MRSAVRALVLAGLVGALVGCSGTERQDVDLGNEDKAEKDLERYGSIFGDEAGLVLFGGGDDGDAGGAGGFGAGLGVNPFLWRAALETTDFMPLNQADPVGGVISTDWYTPPETPDERFNTAPIR